jgi:hypothetical protein
MVTRGYPSLTYLHDAAEIITAKRTPAFLYYFGDHDPSGADIPRNVERRLREFAPGATVHFQRVAVTTEQIEDWQLPTRPTKTTDSRSRSFAGESVGVDAIPPARLRALVEDCIFPHLDDAEVQRLEHIEEEERATLRRIAAAHPR